MNQNEWVARRREKAKCKIHGLHYDPQLTSGCALCRKEGLAAEPRKKPQLVVMLLALLGVAVVAYRMFGPGSMLFDGSFTVAAETDAPEAAVDRPAVAPLLDPERHRGELESVQGVFSGVERDLLTVRDGLISAFAGLEGALRSRQPTSRGLKAAEELGAWRRRLAEMPPTLQDLRQARQRWVLFEQRYFRPASWLARPVAEDSSDPLVLTAYHGSTQRLLSLLDEGVNEAQRLTDSGEILSDAAPPGSPEAETLRREDWSRYLAEWRDRLAQTRRNLPPRPGAETNSALLLAAQKLEEALSLAAELGGLAEPREFVESPRYGQILSLAGEAQAAFESGFDGSRSGAPAAGSPAAEAPAASPAS